MTGNALIDKILVTINVLVVAAGIGSYVYFSGKESRLNSKQEISDFNQSLMSDNQDLYVELPNLTVNLVSERTSLHYLDTQVSLIPLNQEMRTYLKKEDTLPKILSAIIEVTGLHTPEEITNVSGKIMLAEKIKQSINLRLSQKAVQKVLFTKFVVQ